MEGLIFGILGIIFHFCFVDQSIFLPVLMATTTQVVKTEFFYNNRNDNIKRTEK